MIELSQVIHDLREEVMKAVADRPREAGSGFLHFELGPIELETAVVVSQEVGGTAKVRFWVMEFDAEGKGTHATTQRVKLTLVPRLTVKDDAPWVSGPAESRER